MHYRLTTLGNDNLVRPTDQDIHLTGTGQPVIPTGRDLRVYNGGISYGSPALGLLPSQWVHIISQMLIR